MLCNGFSNTIEHPLQIIEFTSLLYFHEDDLILTIPRLDIHSIKLIVDIILIALALQNLDDMDRFVKEHCYQPLENAKVSLVAQHALGGPIETNILVVVHSIAFCGKLKKKRREKELSYNIFFKRDGNSRNTITFAGKNLCHFALSLFFLLFRLGFSQPKCIYSV